MCSSDLKNGIVCVFDETITGFRFSKGGAQEIFNVKPHLTTFGKGIANGFPLSVIGGKAEIMNEMENIFFSGTFGGELVSLAAANFVLNQHLEDSIAPELHRRGSLLDSSFNDILLKNKMSEYVYTSGHPSWKFINWKGSEQASSVELKTLFLQEVLKEGIIVLNSHNISLSHDDRLVRISIEIYEKIFEFLSKAISSGNLSSQLEVEPLKPLFVVR